MLFHGSMNPVHRNALDLFICRWIAGLNTAMGATMASKPMLESKLLCSTAYQLTISRDVFHRSMNPVHRNALDLFICRWIAGLNTAMGATMASKPMLESKLLCSTAYQLTISRDVFHRSMNPVHRNALDLFICRWIAGLNAAMGATMAFKPMLESKLIYSTAYQLIMSKDALSQEH
jgi:hypothetical protein